MEEKVQKSSQRTIDSAAFDESHICDVIESIQNDEQLKDINVVPVPPKNYRLELAFDGSKVYIADIAKLGAKYFVWFNPQIKDQDSYEKTIKPVYERLKEILTSYARKEVQKFLKEQRSTQESS